MSNPDSTQRLQLRLLRDITFRVFTETEGEKRYVQNRREYHPCVFRITIELYASTVAGAALFSRRR